MGVQGIAILVFAWVGVVHPDVLTQPVHDYHFVRLVDTPPPMNHQPAPARVLKPPVVEQASSPDVLRLPPEIKPKVRPEDEVRDAHRRGAAGTEKPAGGVGGLPFQPSAADRSHRTPGIHHHARSGFAGH